MGILLSLFFGFAPMFFFAYILYWLDRYEKEPKILLGGVFLWGMLVAAGGAFIVNTLLGLGVYIFTGSELASDITTGSIIAPVVEECLKGFAVLVVFLVFRQEFDNLLDGIVYAGITALGFAATENTYYIYSYGFLENGYEGLIWLIFVRVILVGWQHPFYTAFIGIGLALSRLNRQTWIKILAPAAGLGLAIFTHSLHNTLASLLSGLGGLLVGTLLDWTGWFFMFITILVAQARERRWMRQHLREEVANGLISAAQYRTTCSGLAQMVARLASLFSGNYRVTNRFYHQAAELAYKKQQLALLGEEYGNTALIQRSRNEIARLAPRARA
jgi:RsiW-degrading membrane proteinase PrsW (M82 family)